MKEKIILRSKSRKLSPVLRVGKGGLTENFIKEAKEVIKKQKLIKIKFLKQSTDNKDKKKLINELAEKTKSELIESVGNVAVIYKK
jgi:RNA-binding protein